MEANYRLYKEEDAAQLADMFYRNRFYLGKTGKRLDADEYIAIQKRRGLLFAIVAELEGEIIAHVGVYPAGCQRVGTPREVFMDSLLIDKKYQTRIYSLYVMYSRTLYHLYEFYPNVRVMISEVNFVNKQSMYLQRGFGGVLLGDQADMYGQLELFNFAPSLLFMGAPMVRKGQLTEVRSALPPTKKSEYTAVEPVLEGRYVDKKYNSIFGEDLTITMDLITENIAAVNVDRMKLYAKVLPGAETLELRNSSDGDMQIHIDFLPKECRMVEPEFQTILETDAIGRDVTVPAGETVRTEIPAGIRSAEINTAGENFAFALPVVREEVRENRDIPFGDGGTFSLDANTGMLQMKNGKNLFKEQWPCLSVPYITGWIKPDMTKKMNVSGDTLRDCTVTEVRDDYDVVRTYSAEPDCVKIHTKVLLKDSAAKIEPQFQITLDEDTARVDFFAEGKLLHSKVCNYARDVKTTIAEMLFLDLLKEPYSKVPLDSVTFDFAGEVWEITADRPFTGFYQHNYLAVNYTADGYACRDEEIDFGTLTIRRKQ